MDRETERLALAVLAYDRALVAQVEQHAKAGELQEVPPDGVAAVFVANDKLDALYTDMLRALAPILRRMGKELPTEWPPELRQ